MIGGPEIRSGLCHPKLTRPNTRKSNQHGDEPTLFPIRTFLFSPTSRVTYLISINSAGIPCQACQYRLELAQMHTNLNTNTNTDTMEFDEIPDDVWISIFEHVSSPAQLAVLMLTCRRFRLLASRPLLRDIRWTQPYATLRNLEAWNGVYQGMEALPRKLTVGVQFDLGLVEEMGSRATPELRLYDMIHSHIPSFSNLVELVLDGTTISPYTYTVLGALPALRTLSVLNCTFSRLHAPGSIPNPPPLTYLHHHHHQQHQTFPPFPFSTLPLTHLSLHNPKPSAFAADEYTPHHPIHLLTASSLTSLSISWTAPIASLYARGGHWPLPALRELDVVMPTLTRDLVDSLVNFVHACTSPVGVRISLCIQHHTLSDQQISSVQIPLAGVWRYEGPLHLQVASFCSPAFSPASPPAPAQLTAPLTTVVMTEPLSLLALLAALEKLPRSLQTLDVQVTKWDIELLFAIRQLFPGIRELVVRYGRGVLPVDFFVTLGSNILYDLPDLHTLKLVTNDATPCGGDRPRPHSYVYTQANGGANANANGSFHAWLGGNGVNTTAHAHPGAYVIHPPPPPPPQNQQQNQQFFPLLLPTHAHPALPLPLTLASFAPSDSDSDADSDAEDANSDDGHGDAAGDADGDFPMSLSFSPSPSSPLSILSSHSHASSSFSPSSFSTSTSSDSSLNRKNWHGHGYGQEKKMKLEHGDLKDYLIGWNRYCRSLRRVQLDREVGWGRRWEGDVWGVVVVGEGEGMSR
ncbi:hypothetical protein GALMADRAFT_1214865 [Galerina marginata CBS 339.88]|uniref:F-box domain-containing protein n=1 Tax=Galerina marginata (strain CBS 339.88) TaxID=685588 RepID=A0A067S7R3_GALM3|nr:hypothetical protein GALMADRAFT_1214865 [Galerina marginata CBS 339.88]